MQGGERGGCGAEDEPRSRLVAEERDPSEPQLFLYPLQQERAGEPDRDDRGDGNASGSRVIRAVGIGAGDRENAHDCGGQRGRSGCGREKCTSRESRSAVAENVSP